MSAAIASQSQRVLDQSKGLPGPEAGSPAFAALALVKGTARDAAQHAILRNANCRVDDCTKFADLGDFADSIRHGSPMLPPGGNIACARATFRLLPNPYLDADKRSTRNWP